MSTKLRVYATLTPPEVEMLRLLSIEGERSRTAQTTYLLRKAMWERIDNSSTLTQLMQQWEVAHPEHGRLMWLAL